MQPTASERPSPPSGAPPLRIVLLVDSLRVPRWVADVVAELEADPLFEIVLIAERRSDADPPRTVPRGTLAALRHRWNVRGAIALDRYLRWDRARYRLAKDPFDEVDLVTTAPVLGVTPLTTKYSDRFPPEALDAVAACAPDVALRFGFRILRGDILSIPRHGVWSIHHGSDLEYRGGPACVWEVQEGNEVTGSIVQVLTESLDAGRVLYRGFSATELVSVHRNRIVCYSRSAAALVRELRRLASDPERKLRLLPDEFDFYSRRLYRAPSLGESTRLATRVVSRLVRRKLEHRRTTDQWRLAYHVASDDAVSEECPTLGARPHGTLYQYRDVPVPGDRFWADPFVVGNGGRYWVFFEEYLFESGIGHIATVEIGAQGLVGQPAVVIREPHHLSYPFVFSWQGTHYMIVESSAARRTDVYVATEFPLAWRFLTSLLPERQLVDVTLLHHGGRWWLFGAEAPDDDRSADELSLFLSDNPFADWSPHPRNPVVTDVRHARPAGKLFRIGDHLYRPAQWGAPYYGHSIALNRVDVLDERDYRETTVSRLAPQWRPGIVGVHTINAAGPFSVIDVLHRMKRSRRSAG